MDNAPLLERLAAAIIRYRLLLLAGFFLLTALFFSQALRTRVDTGFNKRLPLEHEYIQTYLQYQEQFGGANRILIALRVPRGDIYTPAFFDLLREATDATFFLPGIDRPSVTSLWTPNTRFVEIVEGGFAGGNVIPADFDNSPAALAKVRENVEKSGKVGLLVAGDYRGALVSAQLLEIDPATGEKLDYLAVARHLEELRRNLERKGSDLDLSVHLIGFAKVMGDISEGARSVIAFFALTFIITGLFVYNYTLSFRLTLCLLLNGLVGVVWQLGSLRLLGFGIDPMSILVPFLIFAISVSHGVQMLRAFRSATLAGRDALESAETAIRQLFVPGLTALVTDTIGFITILLIKIEIIQELAIAATMGVAALIFTNLLLLPALLSFITLSPSIRDKVEARRQAHEAFWKRFIRLASPRNSLLVCLASLLLLLLGWKLAGEVQVGDLQPGVPELRESSRYNRDTAVITNHFNIGVDIITVIVEAFPDAVVDAEAMELVDRFEWHLRNLPGVQGVLALPGVAKNIAMGYNQGSLKWMTLPQDVPQLAQAVGPIETATGLLNPDGSVLPVYIYLEDHKAETISSVIAAVKDFRDRYGTGQVSFRLATGNVGVMGATNEVVQAAQFPILFWVFGSVIALCYLTFRSWRAAFCIIVPLALVSVLAYALMALLQIGLKVSTLPVVALGVGVGVDYGIYLFSRLSHFLRGRHRFEEALYHTFHYTGSAVVFTGLTLAVGVATWNFSAIKFQADMGILLTFMFLVNMLGAMILLPALARWLFPDARRN